MAARKKARKGKKAAGKKAPRKSASKKKGKKKPGKKKKKSAVPKEFVIKLISNDQGVDSAPHTSRKRRDLVKWVNQSTVERRLKFNGGVWPFEGAPSEIIVPLNGSTGWYRVEKRANESGLVAYSYYSSPPFKPGGPPGDPVMDSGD